MNVQLSDGRHTFSIGAEPAQFVLPAVHPLGQGQLFVEAEIENGLLHSVKASFGDGHRGDEKLLEVRDFRQGLSLINRHNWLTPAAAEIAYAMACEELMGLTPPPRAVLLRELVLNLQIVTGLAQHLAGNSTNPAQWLSVREKLVELTETITGARLHVSFIRLGGVAHNIDDETIALALQTLDQVQWPDFQAMDFDWLEAHIEEFNTLKSSLITFNDEARTALTKLKATEGGFDVTLPKVVRVPIGQSYKQSRAATGEVGVWVHSDGGKSPLRVALRSPSLMTVATWQINSEGKSLKQALGDLLVQPLCYGEIER